MGRFPKLRTLGFRVYSLAIRPFGGTDLEGLYRVFMGYLGAISGLYGGFRNLEVYVRIIRVITGDIGGLF